MKLSLVRALTAAALVIAACGYAEVVDAQTATTQVFNEIAMPTDRLNPNNEDDLKVISFITNLTTIRHTTKPNTIYWRPVVQVANNYAISTLENLDNAILYKDINATFSTVRKGLSNAYPDVAAAESNPFDTNAHAENATLIYPITENEAISEAPPTGRLETVTQAVQGMETLFPYLTSAQQSWLLTSLNVSLLAAGHQVIPASQFNANTAFAAALASKTAEAGLLTIRVKVGLTEEQTALFAKYRDKYPEYSFVKLSSSKPATIHLSGVTTNAQRKNLNASDTMGASIFNQGSTSMPLADSAITFEMSGPGWYELQKKMVRKEPFILPIGLDQSLTVKWAKTGTIVCDGRATLEGNIRIKTEKYNNSDRFIPQVMEQPEWTEDTGLACRIQNQQNLTAEDYALLKTYEQIYWDSWASRKDAAEGVRDEMLWNFTNEVEGQFNSYLPEHWRSYLTTQMTTQCRTIIRNRCNLSIFGACILGAARSSVECRPVLQTIERFYKETIPLYQVYSTNFSASVDMRKSYSIGSTQTETINVPLSAGLCVSFTGDELNPGISCDEAERLSAQRTTTSQPPRDSNEESAD